MAIKVGFWGLAQMRRKIAVVTGARADYGYLRPLINEIKKRPKLELLLYVTGMHLVKEYGNTIQEIKRDGFRIARTVDMEIQVNNTDYDMTVSIGKGIIRLADAFKKDKPDIVVIFGDRVEALATAIAAAPMNIPIAHIGGGDTGMGDIDNSIRHAITKFANLHFSSTELSKKRVLKLGEEAWRVFQVGALCLDTILNTKLLSRKRLSEKYGLPNRPFIIVFYHPVTTEWQDAKKQMNLVMDAVTTVANEENMEIVVIYPDAYPGGFQIVNTIKARMQENIHVFPNLPYLDYLSLMASSSVLVGNTSSGVLEGPSLGVPYVCIGIRQEGRERAKNVIDVKYDKAEIMKATRRALHDAKFLSVVKKRGSPYGDGKAGERIVKILGKIKLDKKLLEKKITC